MFYLSSDYHFIQFFSLFVVNEVNGSRAVRKNQWKFTCFPSICRFHVDFALWWCSPAQRFDVSKDIDNFLDRTCWLWSKLTVRRQEISWNELKISKNVAGNEKTSRENREKDYKSASIFIVKWSWARRRVENWNNGKKIESDGESPERLEERRKNPQRPLFHHPFSSHFSCSSADEFNFSPFNTQSSSSANLSSMYLKNPYNFGIAMPVDSFHTMGYQTGSLGQ